MKETESIKDLEKKLNKAWKKKLKSEGFEPIGSAGSDYLYKMIKEKMKKYKPIEMRVIHEAVFDPKYINTETYHIYMRM
jgi:hypothetical protein